MALLKFHIKKEWWEREKHVVVEADEVFDVTSPSIAKRLIEMGHASPIDQAGGAPSSLSSPRRGRPPKHENKDLAQHD